MRYLIAIIIPPLAVLLCGKPIQAILNLFLTLMLWLPGVIHAAIVVAETNADARARRISNSIKRNQ